MKAPALSSTRSAPAADAVGTTRRMGIVKLINLLRVEIIDALDRELAEFDITAPQLLVLSTAVMEDPPSPAQVCKTLSYDPGAMTRMVDRLEQKGLLRRVANPNDRRATQLAVTAAGKALYPQLMAAKDRVAARFLKGLSPEEVRQLEGMLNRMLGNR